MQNFAQMLDGMDGRVDGKAFGVPTGAPPPLAETALGRSMMAHIPIHS
jgi:hypothetical protein